MHSDCACTGLTCQEIVVRAYHELRLRGRDDVSAFRAAVNVLALRHPENKKEANLALVAGWLTETGDNVAGQFDQAGE